MPTVENDPAPPALRAVALLELLKGLIVLAAGFGLLEPLHRDVRHLAIALVTRLHIDPERHLAGMFIEAAGRIDDTRLLMFATLAVAYALLRFVEGFGLWRAKAWALWLGATSGAIYLPIEAYELWSRPSAIRAGALTANLLVVAYLVWSLGQRRRAPRRPAA